LRVGVLNLLENPSVKRKLAAHEHFAARCAMANASTTFERAGSRDPNVARRTMIRRLDSQLQLDRTVVDRVRSEFNEMCGFSPTSGQAARLFGLTQDDCAHVLQLLMQDGFLWLDQEGRYRVRSS
jgi:hypothetical protein